MNKRNLLKMADHIETVPQELFDMELIRKGDTKTRKCNSVGCIIGHSTVLDKNPLPRLIYGSINFLAWSKKFTGIRFLSDEGRFLFASAWQSIDNTPVGAAKRIRYFVKNGLPENWLKIMYGENPLPY
jgi:hypothetical protein